MQGDGGLNPHQFQKPDLIVDTWEVIPRKNCEISKDLKGNVKVKEEDFLMYLGFMLSKTGSNLEKENIFHTKETGVHELKNKY